MPRAHGVQNPVEERERGKGQRAGHGIVGLEALDAHGKRALQALLLVEHPGEQAAERPARLEGRRDRSAARKPREAPPPSPRTALSA